MVTSYKSFSDPKLVSLLKEKGIKKFISYEVSIETVRQKYGNHFDVVLEDLRQADDLRVIDYDGHHVFYNFKLKDLGKPFIFEE